MRLRIRWNEKAKRIAERLDMEDDIEIALDGFRPIKEIGVKDEHGDCYWWRLDNNGTIQID